MQEIDIIIDDDTGKALELVNLDIRNQKAHRELSSYNDTGKFLHIHPLTVDSKFKKDQREVLRKMKDTEPDKFLNEITNLNQNIRRIETNIRKKKYKDEAEHQGWIENLNKAKIKREIIIELM